FENWHPSNRSLPVEPPAINKQKEEKSLLFTATSDDPHRVTLQKIGHRESLVFKFHPSATIVELETDLRDEFPTAEIVHDGVPIDEYDKHTKTLQDIWEAGSWGVNIQGKHVQIDTENLKGTSV